VPFSPGLLESRRIREARATLGGGAVEEARVWFLAMLAAWSTEVAWACSPPDSEHWDFEVIPDAEDTVAPLAPIVLDVEIDRGRGLFGGRDCLNRRMAILEIGLEQPADDTHTLEDVAYRARVADGDVPDLLVDELIYYEDKLLSPDLYLYWYDPLSEQRPLDFTLEVVAVDRAGNESEPVLVDVTDSDRGGGCTTLPGPSRWPLALLALGLVRRRWQARGPR